MSSAVAGSAAVVVITTSPMIHSHIGGGSGGAIGISPGLSGGCSHSPINTSFVSIDTPELIHRHYHHPTPSHATQQQYEDDMTAVTSLSGSPLLISERKIKIRIRGTLFETFESTLSRYPETLLGCSLKRDRYYDFARKEYQFDRNRDAFNAILFYYQSWGKLIRPYDVPEEEFIDDLEFFEIDLWNVAELEYGGENFRRPERKEDSEEQEDGSTGSEKGEDTKKSKNMYVSCDGLLSWPCVVVILVYVLTTCLSSRREYDAVVRTSCDNNNGSSEAGDNMVNTNNNLEQNPLLVIHIACTLWFSLELFLRFTLSIMKMYYVVSLMGFIDITCVLSTFLQLILRRVDVCEFGVLTWFTNLLRAASILCVFKLSRYSRGLKLFGQTIRACSGQLILSLYCVGICLLVFATIVYYVEYPENSAFASIPDSMWYGIVTLTTVGYGDLVPRSTPGQLFGAMCSVFGVTIVMAWPATIFVSYFTDIYNHEIVRKKHKKRSVWSRGFYKFKKSLVRFENGGCGVK